MWCLCSSSILYIHAPPGHFQALLLTWDIHQSVHNSNLVCVYSALLFRLNSCVHPSKMLYLSPCLSLSFVVSSCSAYMTITFSVQNQTFFLKYWWLKGLSEGSASSRSELSKKECLTLRHYYFVTRHHLLTDNSRFVLCSLSPQKYGSSWWKWPHCISALVYGLLV